jgi:hypothetical protein
MPCGDTPATVYFWVTEPFGMKLVNGSLSPIGQENDGYNCAPVNPYFVGWNNQFGVVNAMLGAAQSSQVTIEELEFETELNLVAFGSHLRLIYDNASPELAPGTKMNIVAALRPLMTNHGFDPLRVTWSIPWSAVTADAFDCTDAYGDKARAQPLDALAAAIWGYGQGLIGAPLGAAAENSLYCGGTLSTSTMQQSPFVTALAPDIVDAHIYPGISEGTDVVGNAEIDYADLAKFLSLQNLQPAPLVMIGETWQGTPSHAYNYGASCALISDLAPADNIIGFHDGGSVINLIVFRPWMELWNDTGACYAYNGGLHNSYQNLNFSGTGPYVPAVR